MLEGRTMEEAAAHLGWTVGSLRGRLLRGRKRLQDRLARRGLAPAASLLAELLPGRPAPLAGAEATARAAVRLASGELSPTEAPSRAAALAEEVLRVGLLGKARALLALVLLAGLFVAGAAGHGLARPAAPAALTAPPSREKAAPAPRDPHGDTLP